RRAAGCSDASLSDSSRARSARRAVPLVPGPAPAGIELDWEYPGMEGAGNVPRPDDKQDFTLLLAALREHLDDLAERTGRVEPHLITIAAGAGEGYLSNTEMARVAEIVDFVNFMSYDFAGPRMELTAH